MLLTNHVLTGVFLGLVLENELVILPVGVASHLIQDALPHVGWESSNSGFRDPFFLIVGSLDFIASGIVLGSALVAFPQKSAQIISGVIGATLPDLTYIPQILLGARFYTFFGWTRPLYNLLSKIQWYEKPPGMLTEVIWSVSLLLILKSYIP